ncbi:F-box and leucine-rich repeat protein 13-like [Liolophura sinensis]|uniref:F-box and leucine-rich repeat protein 13-like n=1 Tax=Liolophura sinensis TaxID=3198878 RepID=UPI0031589BD0
MAASMKDLHPELREYLLTNKLPDVYEALLTGLAVMCPDDPIDFLIQKIAYVKRRGLGCLQWDMFVSDDMKPHPKVISESSLDYIFYSDDKHMPTPEMYETAYAHYNLTLLLKGYRAWMQYHLRTKWKRELVQRKLEKAARHHAHRHLRICLNQWKEWLKFRKGRQAMSFQKIQYVYNVVMGRLVFDAWFLHTLDARKTREYFEVLEQMNTCWSFTKLERGENMEDEELFVQGTGEAKDSISMLPKNVAVLIFSFVDITDLSRCACVCRSWKMLTLCSLLWSKMDLSTVKNTVTDKVVVRLLAKCRPYLVQLNLQGCRKLQKPTFLCISECRNLQDLNLSECSGLTDSAFKMVVAGCKILLYLNISHTSITDASLQFISEYCGNLQFLSLAFCGNFTDKGLHYLACGKNCGRLQYLDLSGCLQITPAGFQNLADGCIKLRALMLNEFPTLNDECIQSLFERCVSLTHVSFLGSPLLTDETFKRLAQCKDLKMIKVDGNRRISDHSMKQIGRNCLELEHVYLADCHRLTDFTLKSLANCKNLRVLNVADCVRISDAGVRHLAEGPAGLSLRELNLTNCVRVGDMAMVNIHKRCQNLVYLKVCFCEHISEAGIELMGQMQSVVSLDISGSNCGDQGLSALGNNFSLRDVSLSECSSITDLGLQKFAQQCKDVVRLDLSHCVLLTDAALKNLAFCCRMINGLNLCGCKLLTDLSIQYLSGVCHYIQSLDISGCCLITEKSLKYLRRGCPQLRSLTMLYCKNISKRASMKIARRVAEVKHSTEPVPVYFGY